MNGIQICTELRKMEKYKKTLVITISSFAMRGDKERIMSAGFYNYGSKPIKVQEFRKLALSYLHEFNIEK